MKLVSRIQTRWFNTALLALVLPLVGMTTAVADESDRDAALMTTASTAVADNPVTNTDQERESQALVRLQTEWAKANYELKDGAKVDALKALADDAMQLTGIHKDSAALWTWQGIIQSTYAGAKGGLGALKLAKASKAALERALSIDPNTMQGSAFTSLGALYAKVPGWPIGFGDDEKAADTLSRRRYAPRHGPEDGAA